jgi:hypothetical protein
MFEGARSKVKWADKHIEHFNGVLNAFLKTNFYVFDIEYYGPGDHGVILKLTRDAPCELPLILGDAIHNLRSALDLAYVELITRVGSKPTKWTTLRVWENRKKLVDSLSERVLKGAPDVIAVLADTIKAYQGGDRVLSALNSLDISDKHILLIPVFAVTAVTGLSCDVVFEGGGRFSMENCNAGVQQGRILRMVNLPPGGKFELKSKGQPTIQVQFGNGTGLEGQPIVPTLTQFSQLVAGIIQVFENTLSVREAREKG